MEREDIERIEAEFEAVRRGQELRPAQRTEWDDGAFHWHQQSDDSVPDDESSWALVFVRHSDGALLPVRAGSWPEVEAYYWKLQQSSERLSDDALLPVVIADGQARRFRPAGERWLVGMIELDGAALLLGFAGDSFVVIHRSQERSLVIYTGPAYGLVEVNLDLMLRLHASTAQPRRVGPERRVARERRMAQPEERGGVPAGVDESRRRAASERVRVGLARLVSRACSIALPAVPGRRPRRVGKTSLAPLVALLLRLCRPGCSDLVGSAGETYEAACRVLGEVALSRLEFAAALRLLARCGTCVVERLSHRTWAIRLAGLTDPDSARHKRFCAETAEDGGLSEPGVAAIEAELAAGLDGAPRRRAPSRSRGEDEAASPALPRVVSPDLGGSQEVAGEGAVETEVLRQRCVTQERQLEAMARWIVQMVALLLALTKNMAAGASEPSSETDSARHESPAGDAAPFSSVAEAPTQVRAAAGGETESPGVAADPAGEVVEDLDSEARGPPR